MRQSLMMRIHRLDGIIRPRSRQDHYCYGGSKQLVVDSILVETQMLILRVAHNHHYCLVVTPGDHYRTLCYIIV